MLYIQPTRAEAGRYLPSRAEDQFELRTRWLELQDSPEPWGRWIALLRTRKLTVEANYALYRQRRQRARQSSSLLKLPMLAIAWWEEAIPRLLYGTVHLLEEAPLRILYTIAITLLLGTVVFAGASFRGSMIPTNRDAYDSGQGVAKAAMRHYPPFNPFIYTLENTVPLVKLGMDDKWTPDTQPNPTPPCDNWCWLSKSANKIPIFRNYAFLATTRWLLIFAGWFQAAVLGAALTSRFKS
jgi:hypothetical protein